MNKFVKSLLVAGSVAALAACSSSNNDAAGNGAGQTFGGYSVAIFNNVTTPFTSVSTNSTSKVNTFKS